MPNEEAKDLEFAEGIRDFNVREGGSTGIGEYLAGKSAMPKSAGPLHQTIYPPEKDKGRTLIKVKPPKPVSARDSNIDDLSDNSESDAVSRGGADDPLASALVAFKNDAASSGNHGMEEGLDRKLPPMYSRDRNKGVSLLSPFAASMKSSAPASSIPGVPEASIRTTSNYAPRGPLVIGGKVVGMGSLETSEDFDKVGADFGLGQDLKSDSEVFDDASIAQEDPTAGDNTIFSMDGYNESLKKLIGKLAELSFTKGWNESKLRSERPELGDEVVSAIMRVVGVLESQIAPTKKLEEWVKQGLRSNKSKIKMAAFLATKLPVNDVEGFIKSCEISLNKPVDKPEDKFKGSGDFSKVLNQPGLKGTTHKPFNRDEGLAQKDPTEGSRVFFDMKDFEQGTDAIAAGKPTIKTESVQSKVDAIFERAVELFDDDCGRDEVEEALLNEFPEVTDQRLQEVIAEASEYVYRVQDLASDPHRDVVSNKVITPTAVVEVKSPSVVESVREYIKGMSESDARTALAAVINIYEIVFGKNDEIVASLKTEFSDILSSGVESVRPNKTTSPEANISQIEEPFSGNNSKSQDYKAEFDMKGASKKEPLKEITQIKEAKANKRSANEGLKVGDRVKITITYDAYAFAPEIPKWSEGKIVNKGRGESWEVDFGPEIGKQSVDEGVLEKISSSLNNKAAVGEGNKKSADFDDCIRTTIKVLKAQFHGLSEEELRKKAVDACGGGRGRVRGEKFAGLKVGVPVVNKANGKKGIISDIDPDTAGRLRYKIQYEDGTMSVSYRTSFDTVYAPHLRTPRSRQDPKTINDEAPAAIAQDSKENNEFGMAESTLGSVQLKNAGYIGNEVLPILMQWVEDENIPLTEEALIKRVEKAEADSEEPISVLEYIKSEMRYLIAWLTEHFKPFLDQKKNVVEQTTVEAGRVSVVSGARVVTPYGEGIVNSIFKGAAETFIRVKLPKVGSCFFPSRLLKGGESAEPIIRMASLANPNLQPMPQFSKVEGTETLDNELAKLGEGVKINTDDEVEGLTDLIVRAYESIKFYRKLYAKASPAVREIYQSLIGQTKASIDNAVTALQTRDPLLSGKPGKEAKANKRSANEGLKVGDRVKLDCDIPGKNYKAGTPLEITRFKPGNQARVEFRKEDGGVGYLDISLLGLEKISSSLNNKADHTKDMYEEQEKEILFNTEGFKKNIPQVLSLIEGLDKEDLDYIKEEMNNAHDVGEARATLESMNIDTNQALDALYEHAPFQAKVNKRSANETPSNIPGGLAEYKKLNREDVDPKQLAAGIKIEMEHTDDPAVAEEIALDHLAENPSYYIPYLADAEEKAKDAGDLQEIK
jgi:hypothetical protein